MAGKVFRAFGLPVIILAALGLGAGPVRGAEAEARFNDRGLAAIKADSENVPGNQSFNFILIGDPHYGIPPAQRNSPSLPPQPFPQMLAEAEALSPNFMMIIGDLIEGYDSPEVVQEEWNQFFAVTAGAGVPMVGLVGNHDVNDLTTEKIWQERIGELVFSFDYGNTHFIGLNSEEEAVLIKKPTTTGIIFKEQIAWLKADLEAHKNSPNIIVFIHEPFFRKAWYPEAENNWEEIHALLKKYPVRAVFAGHWHEYRKMPDRDGIQYVVTGGGGGKLEGYPELGQYFHYLLVKVEGQQVSWSVIKPGAVLPADTVTEDSIREYEAANSRIKVTPEIGPEVRTTATQTVTVTLSNPAKTEAAMKIFWDLPNAGWQVTPETAEVAAPAGKTGAADFTFQTKTAEWFGGPLPGIRVEMPILEGKRRIEVRQGIEGIDYIIRFASASRPLTIDGDFSDWGDTPAIWVRPYCGPEWTPEDALASFRVLWDKQWVYLSGEMRDKLHNAKVLPVVGPGDSMSFAFKNVPGGPDFYWASLSLIDGEAILVHNRREESGAWTPRPIPGAKVAIVRREDRTRYEAAFPLKELFSKTPRRGDDFLIQYTWCDLDREEEIPPEGWTELKTVIE